MDWVQATRRCRWFYTGSVGFALVVSGCREQPLAVVAPQLSAAPIVPLRQKSPFRPGESQAWSVQIRGVAVGRFELAVATDRAAVVVEARFHPNRFARQWGRFTALASSRFDQGGQLLEAAEDVTMGKIKQRSKRRARQGARSQVHSPLSLLGAVRHVTIGQVIRPLDVELAGTRYRATFAVVVAEHLDKKSVRRLDLELRSFEEPKRVAAQISLWIVNDSSASVIRFDIRSENTRVIATSIYHQLPAAD